MTKINEVNLSHEQDWASGAIGHAFVANEASSAETQSIHLPAAIQTLVDDYLNRF